MDKLTEPKPCPFCGGEALAASLFIGDSGDAGAIGWAVVCRGCGARVQDDTSEDAIAAWNTRTTDAELERLREALSRLTDAAWNVACRLDMFEPETALSVALKLARAALDTPSEGEE